MSISALSSCDFLWYDMWPTPVCLWLWHSAHHAEPSANDNIALFGVGSVSESWLWAMSSIRDSVSDSVCSSMGSIDRCESHDPCLRNDSTLRLLTGSGRICAMLLRLIECTGAVSGLVKLNGLNSCSIISRASLCSGCFWKYENETSHSAGTIIPYFTDMNIYQRSVILWSGKLGLLLHNE